MGKKLLEKNGYESVATAPPSLNLMVKKFKEVPSPTCINNWESNAKMCGDGLTVFISSQCPYLADAFETILKVAKRKCIKS
jgi:hypothetical protein